jgi:hypothetical protein
VLRRGIVAQRVPPLSSEIAEEWSKLRDRHPHVQFLYVFRRAGKRSAIDASLMMMFAIICNIKNLPTLLDWNVHRASADRRQALKKECGGEAAPADLVSEIGFGFPYPDLN